VKTVGGGSNAGPDDPEQTVSKPKPTDFTVDVEPEDLVTSLYTQIENITGLKKGQQRLIYRGRLLGDGSLGRIKDVDGLGDGQTIHLVPKRAEPVVVSEDAATSSNIVESSLLQSSSDDGGETAVGSASAGILAALLGLGSSSGSNLNDGDNDDDEADAVSMFPLPRPRSTRMSTRRRTANVYRRFATDPRYPEPGPIEPVRQSLMTLHTMVGSRPHDVDEKAQESKCQEYGKRKWYKGQWLDCRDTVNQWLEATVVEIVSPDEILKGTNQSLDEEMKGDPLCISLDPAIGAEDMDGRRKLLIESTDDKSDTTLSELNNDEHLIGFRERDNNENIQLLLVHYNGWPRRWDEWMRSDSERIRPFRTRSKHVPSQSHICPTPNSVFENAPNTHITHEDDEIDRLALLPELHRSLGTIQDLFSESLQIDNSPVRVKTLTLEEQLDLATAVNKLQADRLTKIRDMFDDTPAGAAKCDDESDIDLTHLDTTSQHKIQRLLQEARERVRSDKKGVEPDNNLPWAMREGDAKPKADDNDANHDLQHDNYTESGPNLRFFNKQKLEALAPLLDRLGRVLIDAAPHVAAIAESLPDKKTGAESSPQNSDEDAHGETECRDATPGQSEPESAIGLFPIQEESQPPSSDDDPDDTDDMPPLLRRENSDSSDDSLEANPDYVDFVNGFIHATRNDGATRSGSIRRGGASEGSLGTSLFSALLASGNSDAGDDDDDRSGGGRGGPRLLRVGGGGGGGSGGGIDIHIHAIVTGGGGGGGIAGIGLDGLGGLLGSPPNAVVMNNPSTSESRSGHHAEGDVPIIPIPSADEDDLGLFSDLYSDNPQPEGGRSITSSSTWTDDIEIPDDDEDEVDDSLVIPTNTDSSSDDTMISILPTPEPVHIASSNTVNLAPPRLSTTVSSISTTSRLQNESSDNNDRSGTQRPRSNPNESRRSNSIGRLFRRVLTRRSSNNT